MYSEAFWKLNTEREVGMGIGPIPDHRISALADRWELHGVDAACFEMMVRAQDNAYLKAREAEMETKK